MPHKNVSVQIINLVWDVWQNLYFPKHLFMCVYVCECVSERVRE